MTSILDRVGRPSTGFSPRTATEFFALRLAHKLNDAPAAAHYAALAAQHPEARLINAYRRAVKNSPGSDLGRRFHAELPRCTDHGSDIGQIDLVAVRVERRAIAAVVFHGEYIEHTQVRQLSSARDKALASAVGFVSWLLDSLPVASAAIEPVSNGHEIQRGQLTDAVEGIFRERMLPIWRVPKSELFEACGYPALRSRKQLRQVVTTVWPILEGTNGKTFIQDAAGLGLYVQAERRFIIN